jgi:hypothetical protein
VNGTIPANYSNFGYIPYGHTIMGRIYTDFNNKKACSELPEMKFDNSTTAFMLAERGECTFVHKTRQMENIGVAVSIIYDNVEEGVDSIIMSDDGTGGGIKIPAMLISKSDGKKLFKFLEDYKNDEKTLSSIAVLATFEIDKPDNRVEYDIWFTSSNDRAMDFIMEFTMTDFILGEQVLMTPHYVFWKCTYCD